MSKLTIKTEPGMVSGTIAMEAIAMEANFIANATQLAQQYFPSVVSQFKSLVGAIQYDTKINKKEFTKSQHEILGIVSKVDYEKLKALELDVPEGFNYNLLKTFIVVNEALNTVNGELSDYILSYKKYLANFVTNKDSKKSLLDMTSVAKKTTKDTQDLIQNIGKLYQVESLSGKINFSDLFENPHEVEKVFLEYHKTNPKFKTLDIKKIKSDIEEIAGLLDSVIIQVEKANYDYLTPEVLKSLSEGSYAVAKSAEAIAIVYFKLIAIFNIVPNLENTITKDLLK